MRVCHTASIVDAPTVDKAEDGLVMCSEFGGLFRWNITDNRDISIVLRVGMPVLLPPSRALPIVQRGSNFVVETIKDALKVMPISEHFVVVNGCLANFLPKFMEDPLRFVTPNPQVTFA